MWKSLAAFILRYGYALLALILGLTVFFGWQAIQVKLSYEFSRAIPTDNPRYIEYQSFRQQFGEDGNLMAIGLTNDKFFTLDFFSKYQELFREIKSVKGVEDVISGYSGGTGKA